MKQFNERFAALQNDAHKQLFIDLYGTDVFDERLFANGYEKFVAGVLQYFRDRPADLLILDIAAGDGWEKLCAFLGRPQPDVPFPKANVTQIRWMRIEDLVALAERAGRELMERRVGSDDAPAATAGAMASKKAKRLLDRVAALATGSDPTEAACRAALKIVVSGLRSLGPNVPFLSPTETSPDFTERRDWNHLWLVDPLDGRDSYAAGGTDFTVNVALIEDGRPIYGVVHAPALGLTYFGRVGRGANKKLAGVDAAPLLPVVDRPMRQGELPVRPAHDGRTPGERASSTSSAALAICRAAESGHLAGTCTPSQPEWKCGAAHAVLAATSAFLIGEADSGAEPRYNSPDLFVPSLSIHAA
jgi:3'(2'), 5'-bisphosphate nucleotidase